MRSFQRKIFSPSLFKDGITPIALMNSIAIKLNIQNIPSSVFSFHVLSSSSQLGSLMKLTQANPNLKWSDLNENQKIYFKLVFAWLTDNDGYNKITSKDPNIIKRKSLKSKRTSSTPKNDSLAANVESI